MDRQVVFRDRQELQADDLNNVEAFADRNFGHVITDAITGERQVTGMALSQATTTSIEVDAGRLWSGDTGEIFALDAATTLSVFSYLPVTDQRYLAVSVAGNEQDTDSEPRDFLVDLQTGETEPSTVAMERARVAVPYITAGVESTQPQKPAAPTGHTLLGYVKLDSSGIVEIEQASNRGLPQLNAVNTRVTSLEAWRTVAQPRIATLSSDVADLANRVQGLSGRAQVQAVALDVARLKELSNLPDTYSDWGADNFLDSEESDTDNADWYARVEEGVRFPFAGATEQQLALFNSLTPDVVVTNGLCLPAYNDIIRLQTTGYAGELSISQYQSQSYTIKQGTIARQRRRYGPTRRVCINSRWWQTGTYDPATQVFHRDGETWEVGGGYEEGNYHNFFRVQQFWTDSWEEAYWYVDTTDVTISGAQVAQTVLQAQNGWSTGVDLYFTQTDNSGVVYLHLCETANGVPDLDKCIASTSVNAADLNVYPAKTAFNWTRPAFVEAGKRYALVITTTGDHYAAIVSGTQYTQGTLFYSMDGAYYQGDFTKDLMMDLRFADFVNPRTVVELDPISLSGGIADLDLLAEIVEPQSTSLVLEYQKSGSGAWFPVQASTADELTGLPALLNLRAVFIGSSDLMPGIMLTGSRLRAQREALTFDHWSEVQTPASQTDDVKVSVLIEGWEPARHTLTCKLIDPSGPTTYTASSSNDTTEGNAIRREFVFAPVPSTGITSFQIRLEGSTDNALVPFHVSERTYYSVAA